MKRLLLLIVILNAAFSMPAMAVELTLAIGVPKDSPIIKRTLPYWKEVSKRSGIVFKVKTMPKKRVMAALKTGDADAGVGIGRDRMENVEGDLIQIPEPLMTGVPTVAYSKSKNVRIDGWESLKGHKVVVLRGANNTINKVKKSGGIVHEVNTWNAAFKFLEAGRADFLISNLVSSYALYDHDFKNKGIYLLAPPLEKRPAVYLYVHKKHEALIHQISEAMKSIRLEGSFDLLNW